MNEQVNVTWLGHACFRLEYKGWSLVIDPYADGSVDGLPPLRADADAVYCSHGHRDHSFTDAVTVTGAPAPEDYRVETAVCPHDDALGARRGMNTVHAFTFGALRVVHMGDVGCFPAEDVLALARGCDLLLQPVGGFYTVDAAGAKAIVDAAAPRAVTPMHYRSDEPRFGFDVIATPEAFLARFPAESVTRLDGPSFVLTADGPAGVVVPRLAL